MDGRILKMGAKRHLCTPGAAAADYVSVSQQYSWPIPLQNSEFKLSQRTHSLDNINIFLTIVIQCLGCVSLYWHGHRCTSRVHLHTVLIGEGICTVLHMVPDLC